MFINSKPLLSPFYCRPTLSSKDLFILSFSGVIYVTPCHINVGNLTFSAESCIWSRPSPFPSYFGLNNLCFFLFFIKLPLPLSLLLQSATTVSPAPTYNLSIPSVFLLLYFEMISFLHKCESDTPWDQN